MRSESSPSARAPGIEGAHRPLVTEPTVRAICERLRWRPEGEEKGFLVSLGRCGGRARLRSGGSIEETLSFSGHARGSVGVLLRYRDKLRDRQGEIAATVAGRVG